MPDLPTYHVLALSGGGYRGLYTATVLAELEAALERPIASHFDLVCGTSVGGSWRWGWQRRSRRTRSRRYPTLPNSISRRYVSFWARGA